MNPNEKLTFEKIERKLKIAADLFALAYEIKKNQLRIKYPDLSELEINHKAYALIELGCK